MVDIVTIDGNTVTVSLSNISAVICESPTLSVMIMNNGSKYKVGTDELRTKGII